MKIRTAKRHGVWYAFVGPGLDATPGPTRAEAVRRFRHHWNRIARSETAGIRRVGGLFRYWRATRLQGD